jgi:hypothetical protein
MCHATTTVAAPDVVFVTGDAGLADGTRAAGLPTAVPLEPLPHHM